MCVLWTPGEVRTVMRCRAVPLHLVGTPDSRTCWSRRPWINLCDSPPCSLAAVPKFLTPAGWDLPWPAPSILIPKASWHACGTASALLLVTLVSQAPTTLPTLYIFASYVSFPERRDSAKIILDTQGTYNWYIRKITLRLNGSGRKGVLFLFTWARLV